MCRKGGAISECNQVTVKCNTKTKKDRAADATTRDFVRRSQSMVSTLLATARTLLAERPTRRSRALLDRTARAHTTMPNATSACPHQRCPRAKHQKTLLRRVRTAGTRTPRLSDGAEAGDPPDPTPRSRRSRRCRPRRGQSCVASNMHARGRENAFREETFITSRFYSPSLLARCCVCLSVRPVT